ncbi:hypothetical protein HaLaN_01369, partial [Haematococcus lacustris]
MVAAGNQHGNNSAATAAEVEDFKTVLAIFNKHHEQGGYAGSLQPAVRLLLEVVFLRNSRRLHQGVLVTLKRLASAEQQGVTSLGWAELVQP